MCYFLSTPPGCHSSYYQVQRVSPYMPCGGLNVAEVRGICKEVVEKAHPIIILTMSPSNNAEVPVSTVAVQ